jgi:hypothetical protein
MEAIVRPLSPILLAALLLPAVVMAQSAPPPQAPIGQSLGQGEQAKHPETQAQGVRPPSPETKPNTAGDALLSAVTTFYRAPPDLAGNPMPRPNWLASNPDLPTDPSIAADPSDLSSREAR